MVAKGYRVFFCTSPVLTSGSCPSEKFEWVRKHFGPGWVSRIVLTSDKTLVRGDVLIDDKPKISGCQSPSWKQLIFDAPYNEHVLGARLKKWADWEVLRLSMHALSVGRWDSLACCSGPRLLTWMLCTRRAVKTGLCAHIRGETIR